MLSRKELEELRRKIEPIKKLALHDDADGVSSAVLLSYVFKVEKVWAPSDFGVWNIKPYKDKTGQTIYPPDVCVDMVPANPKWDGFCIDHHPAHPPEDKRVYRLIHGDVPTAVIIYKLFRNYIPKEHRWKVVVGAVGDGQPEVIPPEIWREYPELLEKYISTWERYSRIETSSFPLYLKLSSPINAACKIPDKWYIAYSVLRAAKSPLDILEDSALKNAKEYVDDEFKQVVKNSHAIELTNGIRLCTISTELKLERTIAYMLEQKDKITTVVINEKTKRGSIRGTLATLVYEHLQQEGFKASGHPGFGGLVLSPTQTIDELYKALRKLKL